jgi:DNA (cytosine-5)-methyltransferase 1
VLTVGSLFSGIGGLELGLEMTGGFQTIWHCEIEPYCCEVLAKHWPGVPNHGDITKVDWGVVERPDLICGGFPCQDISVAGKGAGIAEGTRSGLWFEFRRCIGVLRPRIIVVENVGVLVRRGLDLVLADLAALRYDAEWAVVPAAAVGAPHRRERLFIVAYTGCAGGQPDACTGYESDGQGGGRQQEAGGLAQHGEPPLAHTQDERLQVRRSGGNGTPEPASGIGSGALGDTAGQGLQKRQGQPGDTEQEQSAAERVHRIFKPIPRSDFWDGRDYIAGRPVKPGLCLLAHGIPRRVAKLKALGNAVVPQVAQYVGQCILESLT